ncbi:TonB family protein [Larkinella soli]|uniref:TonB family protein n=1 Tax=Larkinella soli TaxID=1770527 RepID=UPI000FFC900B|nr:TonB family protein [Larkinella soli]
MRTCLKAVCLLLLLTPARAQQLYKEFEVDSAARPRGGFALLERFLDVNRRMPYAAEVSRVQGRVILSAIVGPGGEVSEVSVLRGLRPDCDREAVRVFKLFRAWQPALKDGKPVRQQLTYHVRFAPGPLKAEPGQTTAFYNKDGFQTPDSTQAGFKIVTPVDSTGIPNGTPVFFTAENGKWQRTFEYILEKKTIARYNDDPDAPDSIQVTSIRSSNLLYQSDGPCYSFYPDGALFAQEHFSAGKPAGQAKYYYPNGMVRRLEETLADDQIREWHWHPNGQLARVSVRKPAAPGASSLVLLNLWDAAGKPLVTEGNGTARMVSKQNSRLLEETGRVKDGEKEGVWEGRFADGGLFYRENYQAGKFLSGMAYYGTDSVAYGEPERNPEFKGGMNSLGQFLASNIRYPEFASKNRIQGRVVISFVVCEDGSLCNYEVIQGVHSTVDREALRVVKASNGKWKPGIQRGKPVRVRHRLPVNFQLN